MRVELRALRDASLPWPTVVSRARLLVKVAPCIAVRAAAALLFAGAGVVALATQDADEPALRYRAPIVVEQPGAFVRLPLPAGAYARSHQGSLRDLRVVDARGERVPFALLVPRADERRDVEQQRDATLYALPRKPADGRAWPLPVEVVVQDSGGIVVKRSSGAADAADASAGSPGWLIDLGERKPDEASPQALRLSWSAPAEFSASYDLQTSADLRTWQPADGGQVMALASAEGPLTQPDVRLPADVPRFVRLVWLDSATAPTLTGAAAIVRQPRSVAIDPPVELRFAPDAEPAAASTTGRWRDDEHQAAAARRALHFDLGGVLPLQAIDLQLAPGTRVAPVSVQGRAALEEPWREVGRHVFYRIERGNSTSQSAPLELHGNTRLRYLRMLPDERAAALDPAAARLVVQARLADIVFAAQGQPPYALLAGAAKTDDLRSGALPITTLVPALGDERPRFGRATLGKWTEVAAVAQQVQADARRAALRPWLLWAVLVGGVAGLSAMVWKLLRSGRRA